MDSGFTTRRSEQMDQSCGRWSGWLVSSARSATVICQLAQEHGQVGWYVHAFSERSHKTSAGGRLWLLAEDERHPFLVFLTEPPIRGQRGPAQRKL